MLLDLFRYYVTSPQAKKCAKLSFFSFARTNLKLLKVLVMKTDSTQRTNNTKQSAWFVHQEVKQRIIPSTSHFSETYSGNK